NTPVADDQKKVLIIGGGPNRIGQGIEFDYCCVHASFALAEMGVKTIMYNCNPETVSTDYDTSDVLYFEPINFECVRSVIEEENPDGIIVHFGGQTPLKLANAINDIGAKIIGTSAKVIDLAEDREKFSDFLTINGLLQPANGTATTREKVFEIAEKIGYPVLVRPSYVLGGRGMRTVYDTEELKLYVDEAVEISSQAPLLVDKFLDRAIELDVDAISDGEDVYIGGIMQHIEEAGIHSGDSACSLPTVSISEELIKKIENQTKTMALGLGVKGLMNVQYAIYQNDVYVIEVNPRASRTVPFVSKATGMPLAKVATRVMWGEKLRDALKHYTIAEIIDDSVVLKPKLKDLIAVKEAVFPFNKLSGTDVILGPEMKSTGEVMGISGNFGLSFAKAQFASFNKIPTGGVLFMSLCDLDKESAVWLGERFIKAGFEIVATSGTQKVLEEGGVESKKVLKVSEGRPNVEDLLKNKEISLVINTSDNRSSKEDSKKIRQAVIRSNIAYVTTIAAAKAVLEAIKQVKEHDEFTPKALQEYLGR
ncbi:MAG: carbamoyl-phosphate synthase large subunit, partial [Campylobacterota bacterium]|nr:carbamoyl-phosphate synthase large subunit [Campylobacterota bacterium]